MNSNVSAWWLGFAIFLMFFGAFFAIDSVYTVSGTASGSSVFIDPFFLLFSFVFFSVSAYTFYLIGKKSAYSNALSKSKEEEMQVRVH